jgi:hypothetical protein
VQPFPQTYKTEQSQRVHEPNVDQHEPADGHDPQQQHLRSEYHVRQRHVTVSYITKGRAIGHVQGQLAGFDGILHKGDPRRGNFRPVMEIKGNVPPVKELPEQEYSNQPQSCYPGPFPSAKSIPIVKQPFNSRCDPFLPPVLQCDL